MTMKQIAQRLQPFPLYSILGLTVCLFFMELFTAHFTHSLTLLMDSYLALCNIIVLVGTIITIKHGSGRSDGRMTTANNSNEELKSLSSLHQVSSTNNHCPEHRLRNTFGWARVDVVVVLMACVFLASLCFSIVLEAALTLAHISHHDAMHHPIPVLSLGVVSLLLNLLAYFLIGGYTFHQGSFLNRDVPSTDKVELDALQKSARRQGLWSLCRDCIGSVVVIICGIIVHATKNNENVAKFVDPALSIVSVVLLLSLSLPFMKESGFILLQTIPDHINIGSLCAQLITNFPVIINVHELHVWRLTGNKVYCTAHIIFQHPKEYSRIREDLTKFFLGKGITHITVQPEFYRDVNKSEILSSTTDCLMQCNQDMCVERHCCASHNPSLESIRVDYHKDKGPCKGKGDQCSKPKGDTSLPESVLVSSVAVSCVSQLVKVDLTPTVVDSEALVEEPEGQQSDEKPSTTDVPEV